MKNEIILTKDINFLEKQNEFISYLDVSQETLKTYSEGLKMFLNYLKNNNIINPTRDDLRHFREELKQRLSINTTNSYLTSVRRFFGYLEVNGFYPNITKDIKSIKISKIPKKQILTLEQTRHIYSSLTNLREKCLFSLSVTTGLRGIEMANAKIEDIQIYNGEYVLWVKCKGHQDLDEFVKLADNVLEDILNYIGNRNSGYIFVSTSNKNKGQGVTTKTLRLEIKNIFKRFGLDSDRFSLHSMRRSSATLMYQNGADIYSIQQVLHHKSSSTTTRYINSATRDNNKNEYIVANAILG